MPEGYTATELQEAAAREVLMDMLSAIMDKTADRTLSYGVVKLLIEYLGDVDDELKNDGDGLFAQIGIEK